MLEQNGETEANRGRNAKQKNSRRIESMGEGEETHPGDDTKVLPRQTRNERGGAMRGMQNTRRIRALPPRKMPLQGQQAVLLFLQDSLLQAGYAGEDKGRYEVGGAENDLHAPRVRDGARLSDDKLQKEVKKGRESER